MNERDGLLLLNAIPGIGNAGIRKMLTYYGSARKILSLSEMDLASDSIISSKAIRNIIDFPKDTFLKAEISRIDRARVKVVTWVDDDYPESLREIADAPIILYIKGNLPTEDFLPIAIIGSRRASFYGISTASKFSARLAELGFTVVSGMARGIDTAAHKGALRVGGKTVAILGSGLANIYPPENRKLFGEISESGAIISEFPMETAPIAYNFPRRNRIISGLSRGVIVVEAAQRSGALITADFALEQGREVFAVPSRVDSPSSYGVHNLIKQGAKLVTCPDDILEDIKPHISSFLKTSQRNQNIKDTTSRLSESEQRIYEHITDRPVHIDELTQQCDSTIPVMSVLLQLELKHLVKQLPGKLFVR